MSLSQWSRQLVVSGATYLGDEVAGIDLGLTMFAMLSNGEKIENPRFFQTDDNALAKAQRRMSKEAR